MIAFFKKIIFLAIVLATSLYASMSHAQSTVRPDLAPILSNPTPANCEFYTQKGGTPIKRVPLDILMNTLSPKAVPTPALAYVPTASGNPVNDRNKIVIGANGITYYIDPNGAGIVLGGAGAGYTAGTGISVSGNVITNIGDLSATNEIQTLSKIGSGTLKLTKGAAASNYIILPDSSATNEMQTLSIVGDSLSISGRNTIQLPSGLVYTGGSGISVSGSVISAVDASATNELQTISISGQDLSITGGNTITLPTATNYTAGTGITIVANAINNTGDLSDTNEAQTISNNITASNPTVTLSAVSGSGGGTVQFVAGGGIVIAGANSPNRVIVTAEDTSLTNEIQTLTRPTAGTIRLQNTQALGHNLVFLPDSSSTNEIELPTQTGNSGKYLSTNGTVSSWVNPPAGADNWGSQTVNASADFAGDGGASAPLELTTTSGLAGTYNNVTVSATGRVTAGSSASYITSEIDGNTTNEIQTLTRPTAGTIRLQNTQALGHNLVFLPDSSSTNEIELPPYTGADNNKALVINGVPEWSTVDRDNTNEIQTLSWKSSATLRLTNGAGNATTLIALPDSSATNEIELPTQTGNSGKVLSTNGTTPSWINSPSGADNWGADVVNHSANLTGNGTSGSPLDLSTTGVPGGTYNTLTVDTRGRVTAASNTTYLTSEVDGSTSNELQTISTASNTVTLSNSGGSVTVAGAGINTATTSGSTITITGTEVDGSISNELQTISVTSNTATLSNSGGSVTISGAGIAAASTSGNTITITATEVDGSITNEIELPTQTGNSGKVLSTNGTAPSWINSPSGADNWGADVVNHSANLTGNGTSGSPLDLSTTGVTGGTYNTLTVDTRGRVTSGSNTSYLTSEVDGSTSNELQTISTASNTVTLSNSGGSVTVAGAGINTATTSGSTITITGTEVDGSITNELQTISVTSNTATLSNSGGSLTIAGAGIAAASTSGNTITITATEVDGSITNEIELPTQTGNSGKVLSTNGTSPSWINSPSGADNWGTDVVNHSSNLSGNGTTGSPLDLSTTGVTGGTYNTITVDTRGRVTSGSNASYLTTEVDGSTSNELQTISTTSNTVTLSNSGGSVTIAGAGINTATTSGSTITITGAEVDGSITNEIELPTQSGQSGKYLTTNGTVPTWAAVSGAKEYISGAQSFPSNLGSTGILAVIPIYLRSGKSYSIVYKTPQGLITDTSGSFPTGVLGSNTTYNIQLSIATGQTGFDPNRGVSWLIKEN